MTFNGLFILQGLYFTRSLKAWLYSTFLCFCWGMYKNMAKKQILIKNKKVLFTLISLNPSDFRCLLSFLGVFLIARNRPKKKQEDSNFISMDRIPGKILWIARPLFHLPLSYIIWGTKSSHFANVTPVLQHLAFCRPTIGFLLSGQLIFACVPISFQYFIIQVKMI